MIKSEMIQFFYAIRCSSNEGIQPKNISSNLTWTHFGSCIETSHNNKTVTKIPCQNGWTFDLEEKQSTIVNKVCKADLPFME